MLLSFTLFSCCDRKYNEIVAKDEVVTKVNELFIFTDNKEWEKVQKLFDEKVIFDMTSLMGGQPSELTPKQITDGWDAGLKKIQKIHHQAGNFLVSISGKTADVFCYATATHYLQNDSKRNTRIFVGSYDIHLVKKESWVIDKFKFNVKYVDGNLNLDKE